MSQALANYDNKQPWKSRFASDYEPGLFNSYFEMEKTSPDPASD